MEKKVGYEIKTLSNMIKRYFDKRTVIEGEDHPTGMQGWIIKYLYDNQDLEIFQRDIEQKFSIRRSTATGILQLMEKNHYIVRETVCSDARLKKLILTPKAIELHKSIEENISELENMLSHDLTEEELEAFFYVMDKLKQNLEKHV